jgi:hypothetical protein
LTVGSGVLGVKVICLEASKWLSHCVSQSIEARKQDPMRTYQNDNVIRQMYNVIHFDLFTIDSKREMIFCMIPKVSRALNGLEAYTKVGCTNKDRQEHRALGYARKNIRNNDLNGLQLRWLSPQLYRKHREHGKPAQLLGIT